MDKRQEQQLVSYYNAENEYVRNEVHSNKREIVYSKKNDRYQWLVLEQRNQSEAEVRQTDSHGKIIAWDNYELTGRFVKCTGMVRLSRNGIIQMPFNRDEISLLYQCRKKERTEVLQVLSDYQLHKNNLAANQAVKVLLKKTEALFDTTCMELCKTIKRLKDMEFEKSIRAKLAKAKMQGKEEEVFKIKERIKGKELKNSRKKNGVEL